jgi:predicted LPLAT superfamily acyltransferase
VSLWLVLVLVFTWCALAVPVALLLGAAIRQSRRDYVRRRVEQPDASWWRLSR